MEPYHHAVVSERLAGENNTGNESWMNNCSALSPSAFFVVLLVRNRVNILLHGGCQLFNINIPIIYRPVNYSVVLLLIVVPLMTGLTWCTHVSWVWWIPNRNAAALLHNNSIRNYQLLDRQGTRVLHHTL
jgi:hypothetical protein